MAKLIEKLQFGKSVKKIVEDFISSMNSEFENQVDFSFIMDEFNEINKLRLDTYNYSSTEELEGAFINTLNTYDVDMSNDTLVDALRKLSTSDKLIKIDDIVICVKLNILFYFVDEYKTAIKKYKKICVLSVLQGGIAIHTNNDISQCINPRINAINEAIYLNSNISNEVSKNILTEFKFDAYEMDISLFSLQLIGKENINYNLFDNEKVNAVFNVRKFLNASTPLKVEDFLKSAQISLLSLYKKYNLTDMIMNYKTKLSQAKVIESLNVVMEHLLDMQNSNIYNACFNKPVQLKSYFFNTAIYEYRTKENIKLHPVFENEQELKKLSRVFS